MKKLLAFLLMFTFAIVLVGCGGSDDSPQSIEITAAGGKTTLGVGDTVQLTAVVKPKEANQKVEWSAHNDELASVSSEGLVTAKAAGKTVIRATSVEDDKISQPISINVVDESGLSLPDLNGYEIKIAQAGHALNEIDPFLEDYIGNDQAAKQKAWTWVEDNYNVDIKVEPYPDYAEWGPARWNYILSQAASNVSDYDFLTVPDAQISTFVNGEALIDVTDWYTKYGQGAMDEVYKQSGTYQSKLYSITGGMSSIYGVLYYNTNLLERLNLEKTPAQLFNEGEWTYSKFAEYVTKAQAALNGLPEDDLWALSGHATYLWVGMSNAGGVLLADPQGKQLDLKNPVAIEAADTLKDIYSAKAFDPEMMIDASITSWMDGRALFAIGDLWFVNTGNRWPDNLWGEGDLTRYDYVPFPRPDGITKEQQNIGLGGTATFVMPIGRDYTGKGEDVTAENIYRALNETFLKTEEFLVDSPDYDSETVLRNLASRYSDSEDSIQAFMYITRRIQNKEIGFYEPFATADNPVTNTGIRAAGNIGYEVNQYVKGVTPSFAEAVDPLIPLLTESLTKAYS